MANEQNGVEILVTLKDLATEQLKALKKALDDISKTTDQTGKKSKDAKQAFSGFASSIGSLRSVVLGAAAVMVAWKFKQFVQDVIAGGAAVESMVMRLRFMTGSLREADEAYKRISKSAREMGLTSDEAVAATVNLAQALDGNVQRAEKMMPMLADLAAATGQSVEHVSMMIGRTMLTGMVMARSSIDKTMMSMAGLKERTTYTAEEIEAALTKAYESPASKFRGAALEMTNTWGGVVKILLDVWDDFVKGVSAAGVFENAKGILLELLSYLDDAKGKTNGFEDIVREVSIFIVKALRGITLAAALVKDAFTGLQVIWKALQWAFIALQVVVGKGLSWLIDFAGKIADKFSDLLLVISEALEKIPGMGKIAKALENAALSAARVGENFHKTSMIMDENIETQEKLKEAIGKEIEALLAEESAVKKREALYERLDARQRSRLAANEKAIKAQTEAQKELTRESLKPLVQRQIEEKEGAAFTAGALVELDQAYKAGIVSLEKYGDERIRLQQEQGDREISTKIAIMEGLAAAEAIEEKKATGVSPELFQQKLEAEIDLQNTINKIRSEEVKLAEEVENEKNRVAREGAEFRASLARKEIEAKIALSEDEREKLILSHELRSRELLARQDAEIAGIKEKIAQGNADQVSLESLKQAHVQELRGNAKTLEDEQVAQEKAAWESRVSAAQTSADSMAAAMEEFYVATGEKSKEFFYAWKAMQIASAIISTYTSATEAYHRGIEIAGSGVTGHVIGYTMAALAVAQGLMRVAIIRAQMVAEGGPILGKSSSPTADNIPAMLTAGEYVHPVHAVKYYGTGIMDAIRRQAIPREAFSGYSAPSPMPHARYAFATGGAVANTPATTRVRDKGTTIVNVTDPQMLDQYVQSRPGERSVINVISKNRLTVRQMMAE